MERIVEDLHVELQHVLARWKSVQESQSCSRSTDVDELALRLCGEQPCLFQSTSSQEAAMHAAECAAHETM